MRHLVAVGHTGPDIAPQMSSKCPRCGRWRSTADYIRAYMDGARVKLSTCPACQRKKERPS